MPVAKTRKLDARSAAIVGIIAVIAALLIGVIAVNVGRQSGRLVLGDLDFRSLNTDNMAAEIEENGPILWPDVASGSRDLWLQHLGDDPARGWSAFDARQPGDSRDCNVVWESDAREFRDPCSNTTYLQDGTGLPQIPVFLDGRELIIDINGVRKAEEFAGYSSS
ncbi:MAG: hypothetical protein HKN94_05715 [Acidimicrobiales bacterium]|nr:hypothetical protein [Acidimicrobiales bacterium]RZV46665.1 MAG: hypothetical protein EX269_06700 [Acidimicrobiales bacterium]